jgi:uncharacterized membrane protein YfcA
VNPALAGTFLAVAGLVAGIVGTAGGITSLISYPALLAVGIAPFAANVTNVVSFIGGGVSSTLASRNELREHRVGLRAMAVVATIGGAAGAALLLATPPGVFAWIVPFLIASAGVLLLAQPRVTVWHRSRDRPASRSLLLGVLGAISVYGGYFGAGSGVLVLAVVLVLVDADLVRANAVKNVLVTASVVIPVIVYTAAGPVTWWAAVPLAIGATVGGVLGPRVTRRMPPRLLRTAVAQMGFGLAGWLVAQEIG